MKKVLLALGLVAVMASSSFAMMNLEIVGLLNGGMPSAVMMGGGPYYGQPLQATALSFAVSEDLSLAIGAMMQTTDEDHDFGKTNVMGIYVNGFYKLMQTGAIASKIGLEAALGSESESEWSTTTINLVYRADAKVLGPVSLLCDVELISMTSATDQGDSAGAITTLLNAAKVGLSVPIM